MEWTKAETEIARVKFHEKATPKEVAALVGKSRGAVLGKWNRLGLKRGKQGKYASYKEEYGMTRDAVRAKVSAALTLGVTREHPIKEPEPPIIKASNKHNGPIASILDLPDDRSRCRWPEGDPTKPGFHFCGADSHGSTYCKVHAARAFIREAR